MVIYSMKHDWEYKKLADLSLEKLSYGSGASAIDYDNNIRYVRITDITDDGVLNDDAKSPSTFDEKYLLNEGDLLFARSGATVGKTYLHSTYNGTCIYAGYLIRFVPNKNIVYPPYVFLYTKSNIYKSFVKKAQNAVAQPNINAQQYGNLSIPVPPLPTQQSIVSELDSLSKIIADCKETLKDYDALEQSIFYDMFGDPVKNDKGWEVKKLGEVCDVRDGTHDSPKYVEKSDYILITSKNIVNGKIDYSNVNYITKEDYDAINQRSNVDNGDIIMAMIGTIGNPIIVKKEEFNFCIKNVALMKFKNSTDVNNIYIRALLDNKSYTTYIKGLNKGGTQKFIALGTIRSLITPVPPLPLQQQFASKIEAIEQMKSETKKALQEAETLFNARMDYWFN